METRKFAELIKARRLALRLTQAEVAGRAGIEQSHVSKIERNLNVQFVTLLKLLSALELEFEIKPRKTDSQSNAVLSPLQATGTGFSTIAPSSDNEGLLTKYGISDDETEPDSGTGG